MLEVELLKYRASEIAAASLILAVKGLQRPGTPWNKEIEKVTGMTVQSLKNVVTDIGLFISEVNPKFLTTLKYKFSKK